MDNYTISPATVVSRGARFLDLKVPGWRGMVSIDTLDMGNGDNCVLAQVMGVHFSNAYRSLGLTGDGSADDEGSTRYYGFNADYDRYAVVSFGDLTEAWKENLRHGGPLADWERELLSGPSDYDTGFNAGRESALEQGRADGILGYQRALVGVVDAAHNAGVSLTALDALSLTNALIDLDLISVRK